MHDKQRKRQYKKSNKAKGRAYNDTKQDHDYKAWFDVKQGKQNFQLQESG